MYFAAQLVLSLCIAQAAVAQVELGVLSQFYYPPVVRALRQAPANVTDDSAPLTTTISTVPAVSDSVAPAVSTNVNRDLSGSPAISDGSVPLIPAAVPAISDDSALLIPAAAPADSSSPAPSDVPSTVSSTDATETTPTTQNASSQAPGSFVPASPLLPVLPPRTQTGLSLGESDSNESGDGNQSDEEYDE